jgi:DNA-binding protein H-NS
MFKLDLLDALSDSELDQLEAYSQALKKRRDDDRKSKAMEEARAILAAAGISLKDLNSKGKSRTKDRSYHGGHVYQHPTNKALTWNAKGQKPKWLRELEAEGVTAREVTVA